MADEARACSWQCAARFVSLYGAPMYDHDMADQILDPLHLALLNLPKIPWKHGILNNCSDDGRQRISDRLAEFKHPLDCRRKDDNRNRAQKWFTGEAWRSFCAGERGSPGGPPAIAEFVMIMAEDMQTNGTVVASPEDGNQSATNSKTNKTKAKGKGRGAFLSRVAASSNAVVAHVPQADAVVATLAGAERIKSALEQKCDPEDLAMIHKIFGSRAQVCSPHVPPACCPRAAPHATSSFSLGPKVLNLPCARADLNQLSLGIRQLF